MREEEFRRQVRGIARMYGWTMQYHTHNSQRSDAGWPDEVFAHPKRKRVIFVEFKSQKGKVRPEQAAWIDMLTSAGMEATIWRPNDMDIIVEVLGPKQRSLLAPECDHGIDYAECDVCDDL